MNNYLNGLIMAFIMYTIIPMPKNSWNEKNIKYTFLSLPIIGVFIGFFWYIFSLFLISLNLNLKITYFFIAIFPLFLTGFIHIDGYLDTCDAIFSRATLEKKKEILKDSRVGAFAVIFAIALAFIYFISIEQVLITNLYNLKVLIFIPIFSRCVAVLFCLKANLISQNGFLATIRNEMKKIHFLIILIFTIFVVIVSYLILGNFYISIINIIIGITTSLYAIKNISGVSGDVCGFIITTSSALTFLILAL